MSFFIEFIMAALKAQIILIPLFLLYRYGLNRSKWEAGRLWILHRGIFAAFFLILCVLLMLFQGIPITSEADIPEQERSLVSSAVQLPANNVPGDNSGVSPAVDYSVPGPISLAGDKDASFFSGFLLPLFFPIVCLVLSLAGGIFFVFRLIRQMGYEKYLIQKASMVRMIGRIRLLYCPGLETPFTSGLFIQRIFIPNSIGITSREHQIILRHEMAHIRNGDVVWSFVEQLLARLFWYIPFFGSLALSGDMIREWLRDREVSRKTGVISYVETLLLAAEKSSAFSGSSVVASAWKGKFFLRGRVEKLLEPGRVQKKFQGIFLSLLLCLLLFGFVFPISTFEIREGNVVKATHGDMPEVTDSLRGDRIFSWPLENNQGKITQSFGEAIHPFTHKPRFHHGIDIAWRLGTPVLAAYDGIVEKIGFEVNKRGNFVVIKHINGYSTLYSHLDKVLVKTGDTVAAGEVIAALGNTGLSTGPHLHFQIDYAGDSTNPGAYLSIPDSAKSVTTD